MSRPSTSPRSVYDQIREDLEEQGVIFLDTDTALKEHPELFKEYFGTVIPVGDNKFASLNTAVWSGGSFIYVPKGVHVEIPLQACFRINTENMGQFERTLIIVDEDAYVHYVEGCTAPISQQVGLPALRGGRDHREEGRPLPLQITIQNSVQQPQTWSPSAPWRTRARPWSGSTATSAPRSP